MVFRNQSGHLPNLIVIGAMKCATTSLHYYLSLHPQIVMSRIKELNFFSKEDYWEKGIEWYKSQFRGSAIIYGETSPYYTNYPFLGGTPKRMFEVLPEAKLIYILRDPIERIITHYIYEYAHGTEDRTLSDSLKDMTDTNTYICPSQYYRQLEQYLPYFPLNRILILTLEELHRYRLQTLQSVFKFLEVDDTFDSLEFAHIHNRSGEMARMNRIGRLVKRFSQMDVVRKLITLNVRRKMGNAVFAPFSRGFDRPKLDKDLREQLIDYLRSDINRLRMSVGREFEHWCV